MKFIKGESRDQIQFFCLDQAVAQDNEVRLIDLFVNSLALKDYGFNTEFDENGRPAYHPADLLRLFIYGYLNRIRSSRHLEKEMKQSEFMNALKFNKILVNNVNATWNSCG